MVGHDGTKVGILQNMNAFFHASLKNHITMYAFQASSRPRPRIGSTPPTLEVIGMRLRKEHWGLFRNRI